MCLLNDRYEEIKLKVAELFVSLNIHEIPINGSEIADKLGIQLIPFSKTSNPIWLREHEPDGVVGEDNEGNIVICYNDSKDETVTNWTILHEIGHVVLEHTEQCSVAEAEANFFAKYAIAPPILIYMFNCKDISDVYSKFLISEVAANYSYLFYQKWLRHNSLSDADKIICELFGYDISNMKEVLMK